MKKYKIFIFFIAMFFLIVTIVSLQKESDDVNENLSKIVKSYGLNNSSARYDKESDTLEIDYYMNTWFIPKNPNEIYAWFESALYFNKKEGFIPKNITIMVDMGEAGWPTYYINGDDFLALCEKLDINVLDYKDEDVRELSYLWIDNNFYYRSSIAYNDYRKEYVNLLTIYNNQLVNTETKAYFRIVSDELVFREQYSSSKSNDLTIIDNIDVDNFYFGQWDQDNNFWFYDNYNGLNVIENKAYIVLEVDEIDISKMPEPFASAYNIHSNHNIMK